MASQIGHQIYKQQEKNHAQLSHTQTVCVPKGNIKKAEKQAA